ncbi:hypothetical protein FACS1894125_0350 [Actinomycetota bacterium]|nr:hypothetical protein FACS1894125_0350 [Actinomycetota bacterium]
MKKIKGFWRKHKVVSVVIVVLIIAALVLLLMPKSSAEVSGDLKTQDLKKTDIEASISTSGNIEAKQIRNVVSSSGLTVLDVPVKEGQKVYKDEVLATLDTVSTDADVQSAKLGLEIAKNTEKNSEVAAQLGVETAQNSVNSAQIAYDTAVDKLNATQADPNQDLNVKTAAVNRDAAYSQILAYPNSQTNPNHVNCSYPVTPGEEFNDGCNQVRAAYDRARLAYDSAFKAAQDARNAAQKAVDSAGASLNSAKTALKQAQAKTTVGEELAIDQSKTSLDKVNKLRKDATIVAPMDGIVSFAGVKPGDKATGTMFTIQTANSLQVTAEVGEFDIDNIALGQKVEIKTDATGDSVFNGEVTDIAATSKQANPNNTMAAATSTSSSVKFEVEVSITGNDPRLKIGMNTRLTIIKDTKKDTYAVSFDSLEKDDSGLYNIYMIKNGEPVKTAVRTGIESDVLVEIISNDLHDGDKYVVDPTEIGMTAEQRRQARIQAAQAVN